MIDPREPQEEQAALDVANSDRCDSDHPDQGKTLTVVDRRHHALERREAAPVAALQVANPHPTALIQQALAAGHRVADMQALVDLAKQMMDMEREREEREAQRKLTAALAAFRADLPIVTKDKHVKMRLKQGGTIEYDHATLGHVCAMIAEPLAKHGLNYQWDTKDTGGPSITVTCIVSHEGGGERSTGKVVPVDDSPGKNKITARASSESYGRRYTLTGILGIASPDDDGRAGGGTPRGVRPNGENPAPDAPDSCQEPREDLPEWVIKALAYCKPLGILRADLEGDAGLGKSAGGWDEKDKSKIKKLIKEAAALEPKERPGWVKERFGLESGAGG